MKIVIFGANGATGRLLTGQALAGGHDVAAVTRRPADFPITHTRLTVVASDVLDARAVEAAVEGADVVLSTLGTPFARRRSTSTASESQHCPRHVAKRSKAAGRGGLERHRAASSRCWRVSHEPRDQPLVTATIGRPRTQTCDAWRNSCVTAIWNGRSYVHPACSTDPA